MLSINKASFTRASTFACAFAFLSNCYEDVASNAKNGFYTHSLRLTHPIDAMLQFDANAHANVDNRVNGPFRY